eukprot:gene188-biopygen8919
MKKEILSVSNTVCIHLVGQGFVMVYLFRIFFSRPNPVERRALMDHAQFILRLELDVYCDGQHVTVMVGTHIADPPSLTH